MRQAAERGVVQTTLQSNHQLWRDSRTASRVVLSRGKGSNVDMIVQIGLRNGPSASHNAIRTNHVVCHVQSYYSIEWARNDL
jgi:hypothetical protein